MAEHSQGNQLLFRREPAAYVALAQAVVAAVSMFVVGLTPERGALVIAVVNTVLGLVLALRVRPIAPAAFTAVIQAAMALAVGFGLNLTADQQGVWLTLSSLIITFVLVRPQVTPIGSVATQNAPTGS